MLPDVIRAYTDAMYVATTLRPPMSAAPARESEHFVESEERRRARALLPLASRVANWLWTRLGRGFGATGESGAPVREPCVPAPRS